MIKLNKKLFRENNVAVKKSNYPSKNLSFQTICPSAILLTSFRPPFAIRLLSLCYPFAIPSFCDPFCYHCHLRNKAMYLFIPVREG